MTTPLRILAAGDPYITAAAFHHGLRARLDAAHDLEVFQVGDVTPARLPGVREYAGDPAALAGRVAGFDVLVVHGAAVTSEVLASPGLRLVCCARGGPVNVDVAAAHERGVPVTNTPGKNAAAVVELTLAFMIMLARGLPRAQEFLLAGGELGASTFEGAEFFGGELGGRALGVVGYGQVGRRVARAATALGMDVNAHDPMVDPESFEPGVRSASLERLLACSDIVSLHARATAENENLMSRDQFAAMQRGSLFINTARESLVDEEALRSALENGHLGGAALDVVRPAPGRNPLLGRPNVIITPHVGGATFETIDRGIAMVADEIARLASGEALRHRV
ncbi:MAG TPA: NAD(P)-dependent oxidoreductase [Gaiellales bacterium]